MTFSNTINDNGVPNIAGTQKIMTGTFTNTAGSNGGDVKTGLRRVKYFDANQTGAALESAGKPVANETFPTSTGDITIVTSSDADGIWTAYGEQMTAGDTETYGPYDVSNISTAAADLKTGGVLVADDSIVVHIENQSYIIVIKAA